MSSADLVIRGGNVVLPTGQRPADIAITHGVITAIGSEVYAGAEVIDARDLVVLPGVVDAHVHFNEPGRADWEGWEAGTRGEPAAGVAVTLWRLDGKAPVSLGTRETDADGRIGDLGDGAPSAGTYRLSFEVGAYYKKKGTAAFLQRATLDFEITETNRRYHIPLLMSPFSCASYRGS